MRSRRLLPRRSFNNAQFAAVHLLQAVHKLSEASHLGLQGSHDCCAGSFCHLHALSLGLQQRQAGINQRSLKDKSMKQQHVARCCTPLVNACSPRPRRTWSNL